MNIRELQSAIQEHNFYPELWAKAKAGCDLDKATYTGEEVHIVADFFAMLPDDENLHRYPLNEVIDFIDFRSENFT